MLTLIAALAVSSSPVQAQMQFPWQQQQQTSAPYQYFRGGIDRQGFGYINQMGRGQDTNGYYQQPVSVQEAWGGSVPDGVHGYRARWDDQIHILYDVQNGRIIRQDYHFNQPQIQR
jgi:hypothetical protein